MGAKRVMAGKKGRGGEERGRKAGGLRAVLE